MKRRVLTGTLLVAGAAMGMGFVRPDAFATVLQRAVGDGTMSFGHDDDGRGLLKFKVEKGDSITGSMLFAAEDHHERFPDVVVQMGAIETARFGSRSVTFSGPGRLHDDLVTVSVTARDRSNGDRFAIKCTDAGGVVVFEADGELFRGDIKVEQDAEHEENRS